MKNEKHVNVAIEQLKQALALHRRMGKRRMRSA